MVLPQGYSVRYSWSTPVAMSEPSMIEAEPGIEDIPGLEDEVVDAPGLLKPWDPQQIRITTKTFTIREIFNQIEEREIDLAPDFQRSFVWKPKKQVLLIESIILGIPLPAFYFNQDEFGAYQVIDGVQRLTTIRLFMANELSLEETHLAYLKDLTGQTFGSLEAPMKRRFAATQIVAHVIEPQTPAELKFDIFNRVNTGGEPLSAQEIRHCMSKEPSRLLLHALVTRPSFDAATGYLFFSRDQSGARTRDNRRMADRELALRFCAFRMSTIADYEDASSLDGFLLDVTRRIDFELSDAELTALRVSFDQAMTNSNEILGDAAFRRWRPDAARRGPINRAVFESQALALAGYTLAELLPHAAMIKDAFRSLFDLEEYDSAVRFGTGDPRKIERRLGITKATIEAILA